MSRSRRRGREVDQRSDIWSLGVVIYEMLTGVHAFPGDYEQATLYAIINTDPEPVTALRSRIPLELERIVNKCLQKNPRGTLPDCLGPHCRPAEFAADNPRRHTRGFDGPASHIKKRRRWLVWAVPVVILALASIAVIVRLSSREAAPPATPSQSCRSST